MFYGGKQYLKKCIFVLNNANINTLYGEFWPFWVVFSSALLPSHSLLWITWKCMSLAHYLQWCTLGRGGGKGSWRVRAGWRICVCVVWARHLGAGSLTHFHTHSARQPDMDML